MQRVEIDIQTSVSLYKSLIGYVKNLRNETSFGNFVGNSKILIQSCPEWATKNNELDFNCYKKRKPQRNTRYDSGDCVDTIFDDHKNFRVKIFYAALDNVTNELKSRSEAYQSVMEPFDFLFNLENLNDVDIRSGAENLKKVYRHDLDDDFGEECIHFKYFMADIKKEVEHDNQRSQMEESSSEEEAVVLIKKNVCIKTTKNVAVHEKTQN